MLLSILCKDKDIFKTSTMQRHGYAFMIANKTLAWDKYIFKRGDYGSFVCKVTVYSISIRSLIWIKLPWHIRTFHCSIYLHNRLKLQNWSFVITHYNKKCYFVAQIFLLKKIALKVCLGLRRILTLINKSLK